MTPYEQDRRYYELAGKWRDGSITPMEAEEFAQWYRQGQDESVWVSPDFAANEADHQQRMEQAVYRKAGISAKPRSAVVRWLRPTAVIGTAAAVAVLAMAVGAWFLLGNRQQTIDNGLAATEIRPGGNRATLTLADGRTIDLNEAQTGIVVGDEISYTDGSAVVDSGKESLKSHASNHMSISTPNGGTYQITLPDGSNVWLNAASTLKYPSRFVGKERVVELEGEAYFEVRNIKYEVRSDGSRTSNFVPRNSKGNVPFKVLSKGQTVEVLGTQFNISAYPDEEETKTTLVEGKVKVTPGTENRSTPNRSPTTDHRPPITLSPGQQATTRDAYTTVRDVDVSSYTAWKDGLFLFDDEPLDVIMRKISRWYDVEVVFADGIDRQERFGGGVSRYGQLQEVLDRLSLTGKVRFAVKERRITVMP